jgi:hypothetical protein
MIAFHTSDEVDVRNITDDLWVHGIVHEVCTNCVWISLDRGSVVDVPIDPTSDRIRLHIAAGAA